MFTRIALALLLLTFIPYSKATAQDQASDTPQASEFLQSLVGDWQMKGRFRFSPEANWIPTGSTMEATLRLKDRALVREIEAKQIGLKAFDVIWYDESKEEYAYIYLSNQSSYPAIMRGAASAENEITVEIPGESYRTVIELVNENEMVARDFEMDEQGNEWISREVFHYRQQAPEEGLSAEQLRGTWKIDLRPTPDSAPYFQEMVISDIQGDTIAGTFYSSDMKESRLNMDWGAVRLAFQTSDGTNTYYTHRFWSA